MPQRLVCNKHDTLGWDSHDLPAKLEPAHLRVRATHGAEKHGTMQAFIRGHGNQRGNWNPKRQLFEPGGVAWGYPIPLGNMQVGIVEESASARHKAGDRILYYAPFAPSAVISETAAFALNPDTNWKSATCLDPASYALCALRDGGVRIGDAVAIFSLGAIGLMAVQLARLAGCHPIIAIDPIAHRRDIALKTGATQAINPMGTDTGALLRDATGNRGVDVVIEYSGTMEALQAALRGVAFGGNVVMGGFPGPMKAGLDLGAEAHMNRPNLIFSRTESEPHRDHPRWNHERVRQTAHRLILDHLIDGELVVQPVLKFGDNLPAEYRDITASPEKSVKLGVEY